VWETAVAAGIAAFTAGGEGPSDEEVLDRLRRLGVAPWLAMRLLVFLPLAFGRVLAPQASYADTYTDTDGAGGGQQRPLAEEPVFAAAVERARYGSRVELERIGYRSAEIDAINQALHNGSQLADLVLSPVVVPRLEPAAAGDGGVPSALLGFRGLLAGHGATDADTEVWIFPQPRMDVAFAQFDFRLRHPALAGGIVVESVAGIGADWRAAVTRALTTFSSSLHPLVAALFNRSVAAGQVEWDRLEHPGGAFELCLGPQFNAYGAHDVSFRPALGPVLARLQEVSLSREVHTLRLFRMVRDGEQLANEVLLDSQAWPAGAAAVAGAPLDSAPGVVAMRLFAVLIPT
jgi:hypothetical protein